MKDESLRPSPRILIMWTSPWNKILCLQARGDRWWCLLKSQCSYATSSMPCFNRKYTHIHMCKVFPKFHLGKANEWLNQLPWNKIASFKELAIAFFNQFFQQSWALGADFDILNIKWWGDFWNNQEKAGYTPNHSGEPSRLNSNVPRLSWGDPDLHSSWEKVSS